MTRPNNFDVLKRMGEQDLPATSFALAPPSNVKRANTGKDGYGEVVFAVPNETILRMSTDNPPVFVLIIYDRLEFIKAKKELQSK